MERPPPVAGDTPIAAFYGLLRSALDRRIESDRGSRAQPVRARGRTAAARAGRPRPRAGPASTWCWSGSPGAGRSAAWCSPGCAASARPSCSTRCARRRSAGSGAPARSRPGRTSRSAGRSPRRCTWPCGRSPAGTGDPDRVEEVLGVLKAFALREPERRARAKACAGRAGSPASTCRPRRGRADTGDLEIDLVELFADAASVATDLSVSASRCSSTRCRTCRPPDVSALCAACHELSQTGAPLIVVGAGLPHLPVGAVGVEVVLGAAVPLPAHRPAGPGRRRPGAAARRPSGRTSSSPRRRWTRSTRCRRLPVLRPGVREGRPGTRPRPARSPRTTCWWPRRTRTPSWRSASSAAGTSGPPRPSGTTCGRWPRSATGPVGTAEVADSLGRKPSSLSPARDSLLKKGLVYSAERGLVAFTVPHFGQFLRTQHA